MSKSLTRRTSQSRLSVNSKDSIVLRYPYAEGDFFTLTIYEDNMASRGARVNAILMNIPGKDLEKGNYLIPFEPLAKDTSYVIDVYKQPRHIMVDQQVLTREDFPLWQFARDNNLMLVERVPYSLSGNPHVPFTLFLGGALLGGVLGYTLSKRH